MVGWDVVVASATKTKLVEVEMAGPEEFIASVGVGVGARTGLSSVPPGGVWCLRTRGASPL